MYASRCRENVRGAGNQSVPCVLSGLRLKSLSILRCWNVYFRGGGQRNQDLLESGHTITPAASLSLCGGRHARRRLRRANHASPRIEKNRDNARASQAMRSMTPWIARRTPSSVEKLPLMRVRHFKTFSKCRRVSGHGFCGLLQKSSRSCSSCDEANPRTA